MGPYDTVRYSTGINAAGEYTAFTESQLKCWNRGEDFHSYSVGDEVPQIEQEIHTYYVALREGGFLHIENDRIAGWVERLDVPIVFDKWGGRFDHETETTENGLLPDERYKF